MPKEECPYEALARIFSEYFMDTDRINTNEDYLNFRWAASLFTESDWSTMKHHAKKMHLWVHAFVYFPNFKDNYAF